LLSYALLMAFLLQASGSQPQVTEQLLKDTWDAAYLEGSHVGYIHSVYKQLQVGERVVIEAVNEFDLTIARFGQRLHQQFVVGNHETLEGKVLAVIMWQTLSKDQRLVLKGKVENNRLLATLRVGDQPAIEKPIAWDPKALGLYQQELLYKRLSLKAGEKVTYRRYEPVFHTILTSELEVIGEEEVGLLDGQKSRLVRVVQRTQKVEDIHLPAAVLWIDRQGEVRKGQQELPGLGTLVTYRTTREVATRPVQARVDVGLGQLIRVKQTIRQPDRAIQAVYAIQVRDLDDLEKIFPQDERQYVRRIRGDTVELVVKQAAVPHEDQEGAAPAELAPYLKSNHYVRADSPQVRKLASQAVGRETEPWAKARRIAAWVNEHIRDKNFSEAFATADEVARRLEGDCTEHAILAAAMCRASGIPARPVVGLVYVPSRRAFGYHMWLEVWVYGRWHAMDPTLGLDQVGITHIKLADHHWNDVQTLTPLLPVVRVLGRIQIEVMSVQYWETK